MTELPESTVLTSRAACGLARSVCQPPDAHTDGGGHAGGLVRLEQGEELSEMMSARHMSIKER